jgi:hypothetical protein
VVGLGEVLVLDVVVVVVLGGDDDVLLDVGDAVTVTVWAGAVTVVVTVDVDVSFGTVHCTANDCVVAPSVMAGFAVHVAVVVEEAA